MTDTGHAAAFGRLCVETTSAKIKEVDVTQPPSGGCVLKPLDGVPEAQIKAAAAFGRLCVETNSRGIAAEFYSGSRLRAAVC